MRKIVLKSLAVLFVVFAGAGVQAESLPREVVELLPVGSSDLSLHGYSATNVACEVNLGLSEWGFDARVNTDANQFAKFQLGLGHNLTALSGDDLTLTVKSRHEAEEQYSSDTRSTLKVIRDQDQVIRSIEIKEESKGLFSWRIRGQAKCIF